MDCLPDTHYHPENRPIFVVDFGFSFWISSSPLDPLSLAFWLSGHQWGDGQIQGWLRGEDRTPLYLVKSQRASMGCTVGWANTTTWFWREDSTWVYEHQGKTPVTDDRNFAKKLWKVHNNMKHVFHFLGWLVRQKIPNVQLSSMGGLVGRTFFKEIRISFAKNRIFLNICWNGRFFVLLR